MTERARHPATTIPPETVAEIAYRTYLRRLEPPQTPEESRAKTIERNGKIIASDETRRRNSASLGPLIRDILHVLVDMGMVVP